ncbi:hypothetical protein G7Z17_g6630 [Cylindrodendrum hubeiense]|uniref:Uncharacterized protein n=1 Tax=Cylindrodendrum hubeiense TaxID=595255 RepID=A0A9P5LG44_9HYPO|nr:hypothetical protein G7Z17_g6630 [Cylindrodendrum hubeiense]
MYRRARPRPRERSGKPPMKRDKGGEQAEVPARSAPCRFDFVTISPKSREPGGHVLAPDHDSDLVDRADHDGHGRDCHAKSGLRFLSGLGSLTFWGFCPERPPRRQVQPIPGQAWRRAHGGERMESACLQTAPRCGLASSCNSSLPRQH